MERRPSRPPIATPTPGGRRPSGDPAVPPLSPSGCAPPRLPSSPSPSSGGTTTCPGTARCVGRAGRRGDCWRPGGRQRRTPLPHPPRRQTRTTAEESCDPLERNCQTPIFTWEARCAACGGSGAARSAAVLRAGRGRGRGRGTPAASYATCVTCSGVGYVRHTSARVIPDLGARAPGAAAPAATTLGRPPPGPDESYDEEYWSEGEEGDG